jgi:hypothetical protein
MDLTLRIADRVFTPRPHLGVTATDGNLNVVVLGDFGRAELIRWLPTLYSGRHVEHPRVKVHAGKTVTITGPTPLSMHLDGEPVSSAPSPMHGRVPASGDGASGGCPRSVTHARSTRSSSVAARGETNRVCASMSRKCASTVSFGTPAGA